MAQRWGSILRLARRGAAPQLPRPPSHLRVRGILEGVEYLLQGDRGLGLLVDGAPHDAVGLRASGRVTVSH